jgi:Cys-tRNA(Pro) deacylase
MAWPEPVERVSRALRAAAVDARLEEFAEPTRTAAEAAAAIGCDLRQIVKSLVFVCDGRPVLALVPGDRRGDNARIALATGTSDVRVATAQEVVAATGFEPGAVSPVAAGGVTRIVVDRSLLGPELVWIGAGSAQHLVGIAPTDLVRITQAGVADLAE